MKNKTLITAHSGADQFPDNSLEYVQYAVHSHADAFEIDVRKRPDGVLVVTHDPDSGEAPTLREIFEIAKGYPQIKINCDLKTDGLELDVFELVRAFGYEGRVIYSGSVNVEVLREHPNLHKGVQVYLNLEAYVEDLYTRYRGIPDFDCMAAQQIIAVCRAYGVDVVNANYVILTKRFIETLRAAGIGVSAWTVNKYEDAAYFIQRGVYNLTTRSLAMVMEKF